MRLTLISLGLVLSLLLLPREAAAQLSASNWTAPSDEAAYRAERARYAGVTFNNDLKAREDAHTAAALQRRGHRGVIRFAQGCDLADPDLADERLRSEIFASTATLDELREAFAVVAGAMREFDASRNSLPTDMSNPALALGTIAARDQRARALVSAPSAKTKFENFVVQARLSALCRTDLEDTAWLVENIDGLMPILTESEPLESVYLIAMHADSEPLLQQRLAFFLARMSSARLIAFEKAARLFDRAMVNVGLPQIYGTGVLCEDGRAFPAGTDMSDSFARNRVAVGLTDYRAYLEQAQASCTGGPS